MKILPVDVIGGEALGTDVRNEAAANPVPAWLLTLPLKGATGPGKFLSVKQSAYGTDNMIGEAAAWRGDCGPVFDHSLQKG